MEGFQNWAEKALNRPMYARRYRYQLVWYRYQKATASFCVGGTGTSKSGTSTTFPFFSILFLFFSFFFGIAVPIYKYALFECPPSRIPLNAHFFSCSYSSQPDLCS